jgi:hypothetical protein
VERAALVLVLFLGQGCASIRVESSGAVEVRPGLRNLAVCFDDVTGKLESVIAYKQSRTFAGQNVLLGAAVGGVVAGPVGAGAGGIVGLLSEALDSATTLLGGEDPVPSCEPPMAPPLKPSEDAATPTRAVAMPPARLVAPALWGPMAEACGGGWPADYCLPEVRDAWTR